MNEDQKNFVNMPATVMAPYQDFAGGAGQGMSLRDFRMIVFRHWPVLLLLMVTITGTATVASFLMPEVYQSGARLLLKWDSSEKISLGAPSSGRDRRPDLKTILNSEKELIKSYECAEQVYRLANSLGDRKPGPEAAAQIARIQRSVEVTPLKNTSIIELSYRDTEPVRAAKMVNLYISAYKIFRRSIYQQDATYDFLKRQIELNKLKLAELRETLDKYRMNRDIISLEEQKRQTLSQLHQIENSLLDVRRKRMHQTAILDQFRTMWQKNKVLGRRGAGNSGAADWTNARKLYQRLIDLRMEKSRLLVKYTDEYDEVRAVSSEISTLESMLEEEVKRQFEVEAYALKTIRDEENFLTERAAQLRVRLKQLPEIEKKYAALSRDIGEYESIYATLLKKKEEKRLSVAQSTEDIQISVINPALVPEKPISPNIPFNISLATLFGLLASAGLAFFLGSSDDTVKSAESIEAAVGLPVLVSIADIKKKQMVF